MRTIQQLIAIFCATLMLAPVAVAQELRHTWQRGPYKWMAEPYRPKVLDPISLANSGRLERLIRAGNLYLSLQDAIALALENNLDVEISRYGFGIARADQLRAQAGGLLQGVPQTVTQGAASVEGQVVGSGGGTGGGGGGGTSGTSAVTEAGGAIITTTGAALPNLDPQLFFRYGYSHRTSPQTNTVTTGGVTAITFDAQSWVAGIQKQWLTGTEVQLVWSNNHFEGNNPFSNLNPSREGSFDLSFTQPLLQGFGIKVNNRQIRSAKLNLRVTELVFEQQVISAVSSTVKLYWDLVAFAEDVKVKRQALALSEKLYSDNKKQVEIGTLAPIEITSAEAQVARRQQELLSSETRLLQQETVLKNALSRSGVESPTLAAARIVPTDKLRVDRSQQAQSLDNLVSHAMRERPEIEQTSLNLENSRLGLLGTESRLKPSLDLNAFANNNGLAGQINQLTRPEGSPPASPNPFFVGGYGTVLGQMFRRNFPDYGVSVTLSIPLRNRSAQADYIRSSLQLRQQELNERKLLNNIRVAVANAEIGLRQAMALYDAAVKERTLQVQTLEAEQKKYALGASTVFFVIQYQRDLAQAQSTEVQALASYAKAKVDLDQAIGRTLEAYNISLNEAKSGLMSRAPDLPVDAPAAPVQ